MSDPTPQTSTDPVLDALFAEGEMAQKRVEKAQTGRLNPVNVGKTVKSLHKEGYTPEIIGYGTTAVVGGFALKNYMKNLNAVKEAIAAEEEAVRKLRNPSSIKGRQPFAKDGFTLTGNRDVKSVIPQRRGQALEVARLSNVRPVGGPEGTGLGVLKGKEGRTAARMTAEQMIKYLRAESNFGVTATTPRVEVTGVKEGETGRKRVVVSAEDVKAGKLPKTNIPAGEPLPPPKPTMSARAIRAIPNAVASGGKAALNYTKNIPSIGTKIAAPLAVVQIAQQIDALNSDNMMDREYGRSDPFSLRPLIDAGLGGGIDSLTYRVSQPEWQMRNPIAAVPYGIMHGDFSPLKAFAGGYVPEFIARKFR